MAVFDHTVLMLACFGRARRCVMMLLTARSQTLPQWALSCEISTRFGFQVAIVDFHLHDSHKLNLASKFLYLFLYRAEKFQSFN